MNKEQLLSLGLTKEQADNVIAGFGTMIPKSRLDDKIKELKDAQAEIATRDKQLEDLKPLAAGSEGLQKQILELQEAKKKAAEEYTAQLTAQQQDFALQRLMAKHKVRNPKAVMALLDTSKFEFTDNELKGAEEQFSALKDSDSYLFDIEEKKEEEDETKKPPTWGDKNTPPKDTKPLSAIEKKLAKWKGK